ncbi:MAG TPA: hypothetical protein PLV55_13595 [Anaerohalosphaeraceae bacterium]|nr:hypothetical protein [Anaerohalosphaeraceae bacterium]
MKTLRELVLEEIERRQIPKRQFIQESGLAIDSNRIYRWLKGYGMMREDKLEKVRAWLADNGRRV